MDILQLSDLKTRLKNLIGEGEISQAVEQAKQLLPVHSDKYNILVQLEKQYKELKLAQIRNLASFEQLQIQQSNLTSNLLAWVDILDTDDFNIPSATGTSERRVKTGSVLYAIPPVMQVQQEKQCVVRLAFDESYLMEHFFAGEGTHIRSLRRIDDRMEVELVDPNEENSFAIRSISSVMQKVERDDYTEWLFFVKPLKAGTYPLYLKVSIIILEDGEKIRKELVLQEVIQVLTKMERDVEAGAELKHSGFIFTLGGGATGVGDGGNTAPADKAELADSAAPSSKSLLGEILGSRVSQIAAGLALVLGGVGVYNTLSDADGIAGWGWGNNDGQIQQLDVAPAQLAKLTVAPPLDDINVTPAVHVVKPDQPTVLTMESGTTIEIPAGVFVNERQQPVTAPVEIHFREFHQPHEIIASGIPMKIRDYQTGHEDWMQTAGMFDIKGFSEGKPVQIATGKTLLVNLVSPVDGAYDFWKFDTVAQNWTRSGPSVATPAPVADEAGNTATTALQREVADLRRATARPPSKPANYDENQTKVDVKVDVNHIPRLRGTRSIIWLYAGSAAQSPKNNPWVARYKWDEVTIAETDDPDKYLLTFSGEDKEYSMIVTPSLTGMDTEAAKVQYEQSVKEYRESLTALRNKEALLLEQEQAAFRRSLAISGFGLYNHDILYKRDDAIQLYSDFDFGEEWPPALKKDIRVYLVTGNNRVVVEFPYYDWSNFRFSPGMDNRLVAVLPGNKIATFTQSDFNAAMDELRQAKGSRYTFKMRVEDRPVGSLGEVQKRIVAAI